MTKRLLRVFVVASVAGLVVSLGACGATNPPEMSEGHISIDDDTSTAIPEPIIKSPVLPKPEQRPNLETYTVIVNQVSVKELLFSMARDAKLNLDIDNNIRGTVTMNAIDQTLPQILERLSRQVDIRYQMEDETLRVMPDKPYLQLYDVNYLNMSRVSTGSVEVSSEISSTGGGPTEGSEGSAGGNNSSSVVESTSNNEFWKTLVKNISGLLEEEVKSAQGNASGGSKNLIVNRETGVLGVRATFRQHKQVQQFLDKVINSAQRQVLIEATIAEVTLSDHYQAGIDWSVISATDAGGNITKGASQDLLAGDLGATPFFQLSAIASNNGRPVSATLKALETFGDVKVLSSPKIMALNNQTAMLKVVDNEVYFTIEVETSTTVVGGVATPLAVLETQVNTVPVGFVMTVLPYIDKNDVVTLNVRPTISRIVNTVDDPNPDLLVASKIPVIQVREIESVLKVNSGDTAVIGGLMQDQIIKNKRGIPLLSSIPWLGALFSYQDDEYIKSELVIFIKPVVIHDASLTGDLSNYRKYLLEDMDAASASKDTQ